MNLPHECSSQDTLKTLRDDLDFATVLMKSAASKNIGSFTFAGLRITVILTAAPVQLEDMLGQRTALEIVIFQNHLHDRIKLLGQNTRMLREIWSFNDRTRAHREFELTLKETAPRALILTAALIDALNRRCGTDLVAALDRKLSWRLSSIDGLLTKNAAPQGTSEH